MAGPQRFAADCPSRQLFDQIADLSATACWSATLSPCHPWRSYMSLPSSVSPFGDHSPFYTIGPSRTCLLSTTRVRDSISGRMRLKTPT